MRSIERVKEFETYEIRDRRSAQSKDSIALAVFDELYRSSDNANYIVFAVINREVVAGKDKTDR